MEETTLIIQDEVNCKFLNLDPPTRRKLVSALKFFIPQAVHTDAYKHGYWDGTVSYATLAGATYINLLDKVLPVIEECGYEITIDDRRKTWNFQFTMFKEDTFADKVWPKGHPHENESIIYREHQVDIINKFLENLQSVQEVATSAGKTLITAALSKIVETEGRSIVIVPNKQLVRQTEADYKNLGLDVGVLYGDRKEYNKQHTICTWQSLNIYDKKSKDLAFDGEETLREWLDDVVCVMVDETHMAKSDVLRKLLAGPFAQVPIRWGLTGTLPQEDYDFCAILATIGPKVNEVTASELQEKGILSNLHINILQIQEDIIKYPSWHDEHKFLVTDIERLTWIAAQIQSIAKSGNTLVLFDRVSTGEELEKLIPDSVFVHGSVKVSEREEHYADVNDSQNKIILATAGVAAVGINIPRIFNLIIFEGGKSFVRTIQSIGRGIRKAKDKDFVDVWDICSNTKYSKSHLTQRKKYYTAAKYPFTITKVKRK